jgi:hypothetical protein
MTSPKNIVELSIAQPESVEDAARVRFESVEHLIVSTDAEFEATAADLQDVKANWQRIDAQRKKLLAPIDEARRVVQEHYRPPLNWLERAELALKKALADYSKAQQQRRQEEQRKADELARIERQKLEQRAAKAEAGGKIEKAELLQRQSAAIVAPVIQREAPKVAGVSMREVWKYEITDPALVPREFMSIDDKKLGGYVRALKGDASVAGVRIYKESVIAAAAR